MEIDTDKVDEAVLTLLYLTLHDGARAWKGFDWDTLNRLHVKGFISDPVSKAKYEGQLQLQRRAGMELTPKPEQPIRHPAPQVQRMMQQQMAANAERNEQRLRVTAIAMMDPRGAVPRHKR